MSLFDKIKDIFDKGHEVIAIADAAKEKEKLGHLRAGSTGAIVGDKVYTTKCIRLDQARQLGYQGSISQNDRVMFAGGLALEDYVEQYLRAAGVSYKKEQTTEIEFLYSGQKLSGRPDFELELDGKWVGVEVKSMASPFSVAKQVRNRFPMMKHMLQAATYCMLTKRNEWLICVGNTFHANDKGVRYPPELRWYLLTAKENDFIIENAQGEKIVLPFGRNNILEYYATILQKNEDKVLGPRPHEEELNITTYNRCKYCPQESACNKYDNNQLTFDQFMENVKTEKK